MQRFFSKLFFFIAYLLITAVNSELCALSYNALVLPDTIIAPTRTNSDLKSPITYNATDSMVFDMVNQKAYLYNNAVVVYEDVKLEAGYIELDFGKDLLYARGIKDSSGNVTQKPISTQGGEKFNAGEIAYNFNTKKGTIKEVITQQGDGYIHGSKVKKDSTDIYYVAGGKYTTCDLEHPHFYIEAKKIKVIPDNKIITGPAELYIADVPTPLVLPFGFFPNKKGRASGILIPTYGESNQWGFFLKDGGFYFGTNEYVDLALRGDIYSNGSYGLSAASNYNYRYHYNGLFNFKYSRIIEGDKELPNAVRQNVFAVQWNHTQDSKANPTRRFSANVNAGSSSYNKYNGNVTGSYLQNTMQSNIAFSKTFPNTPFAFSANGRHSQNTITKKVDLSLPELTFAMTRIYPIKMLSSNTRVSNKWYDKIGLSLTANAKNDINTYDSLLFQSTTLKHMRNGVQFTMPITTSMNVLKYLTFTPSISTRAMLYKEAVSRYYDVSDKQAYTDTINGVKVGYDYSVQGTLNTRLYGDYFFRSKRLKQIRHVATPSVTASYRPDFSESKYGFYNTVQIDSTGKTQQYSIFQTGIYGSPASGRSGVISYGLGNTLEAKIRKTTDSGSVDRKVVLIDYLSIGASYNMALKHFNWSGIAVSGRTKLFKSLDINANMNLDPYMLNDKGTKIEKFEWNHNKRIGRITSASLALGTSLRAKEKNAQNKNNTNSTATNAIPNDYNYIVTHPNAYVDFNIPWNVSAYYNLNYSKPVFEENVTQTITYNGSVYLTKNWEAGVTSGYDFTNKKATITSINVHRNLHCWEMTFTWVPFGFRQSFMLNINVKSSTLKDLKLTRKRDWYDYQ